MAGIQEIKDIYKEQGNKFIEELLEKYTIISENLDGSTVYVQKIDADRKNIVNDPIDIFKRDDRIPLSIIDRTLMIYYESVRNHFVNKIDKSVLKEIPDNWRFSFQYFVNKSPVNIVYDNLPTNNLVLTHILVKNNQNKTIKVIDNSKILNEWANKLEVQGPPIIFEGVLNDKQKNQIKDFIKTDKDSLGDIFGTDSFTKYIISILNPSLKKTTLNNDLIKPIDSIVFKFFDEHNDKTYIGKIIDPIIKNIQEKNKVQDTRTIKDIYSIILLDIIEFIERNKSVLSVGILSIKPDERYIEIICDIFNKYVNKNIDKYKDIDFETPSFAKKKEFDLNIELIKNQKTKEYLNSSDKLKDLFKIFLSSLRKKRKKTTNVLTEPIIKEINIIIGKIKDATEAESDDSFKTFGDYIIMKEMNDNIYEEEEDVSENSITITIESNPINIPTIDFLKKELNKLESNIEKLEDSTFEALNIKDKEHGKQQVNIFVGRFQPFTLGHIKVLNKLHMTNKLPVIIFIVKGKETSQDKDLNPFDKELQLRMFDALKLNYEFLENVFIIDSASVDKIFNSLRPEYEPLKWGVGTDRLKTFKIQIDKYKDELNMLNDFELFEIKRADEDISASVVRTAIKDDNYEVFKVMVPTVLHSFYDELKKEIYK